MPLIVELKTATLDYGTPGVSPTLLLLSFALMFAVGMMPYFFLYRSLLDKPVQAAKSVNPFRKMMAWTHSHRHPELLHH